MLNRPYRKAALAAAAAATAAAVIPVALNRLDGPFAMVDAHASAPVAYATAPATPAADPVAQATEAVALAPMRIGSDAGELSTALPPPPAADDTAPAPSPLAPQPPEPAPEPPAPRAAPPAPDPFDQPHANWLMLPSVGVSLPLTDYRDCSAATDVPAGGGVRDWCAAATTVYLAGHNPGVFTPLLRAHPGDLVRYWDGAGAASTYRIASSQLISRAQYQVMTQGGTPRLVMQTCAVLDGSQDWVFTALPV